jgi:hypothetical protein
VKVRILRSSRTNVGAETLRRHGTRRKGKRYLNRLSFDRESRSMRRTVMIPRLSRGFVPGALQYLNGVLVVLCGGRDGIVFKPQFHVCRMSE